MRQQLSGGRMRAQKRDMTGEQTPPSRAMGGGGAWSHNVLAWLLVWLCWRILRRHLLS
jgi:hypothetical protein